MSFSPREHTYKRDTAFLTVGIDNMGNVYSFIEKAGKVVARDFLLKMPSEVQLAEKGWVKINEPRS